MSSSSDEDLHYLSVISIVLSKKKSRKRKSVWVRDWISRRPLCGAYNALLQELEVEDPRAFKNFLRMDQANFQMLLTRMSPYIQKKSTMMRDSIPAGEKLALTLRFLASGDSYGSLEFLYRIPRNTICQFIPEVCEAIYHVLHNDYLQVPNTTEKWEQIQEGFLQKWQFPNCIGAIDGKHISLKAPANSGSEFYNYKKFFSIILLALVDSSYKFIFVDIGANGRVGDAAVYGNSELCHALENRTHSIPVPKPLPGRQEPVPAVVVGDDAFGLKPHLLKPYPLKNLSDEKKIFNYRLSRARRVSENAFGILASRFSVLGRSLQVSPEVATSVVKAAVALHNFLQTENDTLYRDSMTREIGIPGMHTQPGNRHANDAIQIRNEFADYFITNGAVEWQWDTVV